MTVVEGFSASDFASGLRRRRIKDKAVTGILSLAMAATLGILVWVLVYVAIQGLQLIGPEFLLSTPPGNPGTEAVPRGTVRRVGGRHTAFRH